MMSLKSKLTEENLYLAAGVICVVLMFPLLYYMTPKHGVRVYDCNISEISPDYPLEVKDACRKLKAEK